MFARALLLCAAAAAANAADTARMNQAVEYFASGGKGFMGVVIVARDGEPVFEKAYGFANLEWRVPNTPDTKFRVGSVSKQFTAAAILLLEQDGKLSTSDLVSKHVPDAPAAWAKVTLHHLLTHTSGIPSFTGFQDYTRFQRTAKTLDDLFRMYRDKPLEFEPGSKWAYSNSGFSLLGLIVERVSGRKFDAFLKDSIFTPLEMKDSGSDSHLSIVERRAAGYTPFGIGGAIRNSDFIDMTIPVAAGSVYSTGRDLVKWTTGMAAGKLLSREALAKMTTPVLHDYGYGVASRTYRGRRIIDHAGGIDGFNTWLCYWPQTRTTVAVLSNLNTAVTGPIAARLGDLAHDEASTLPSERKPIELPESALKSRAGSYASPEGRKHEIAFDDGKLYYQAGPAPKMELLPESADTFFLRARDLVVKFTTGGLTILTGLDEVQATKQ